MNISLRRKLIFSYLVVALVIIAAISVIIRLTSGQTLMNLVVEQQTEFIRQLVTSYYERNGTLSGFNEIFDKPPFAEQSPYMMHQPDGLTRVQVRGLNGLVDTNYRAVIYTLGYEPGQDVPRDLIGSTIPIRSGNQVIAYILPDDRLSFSLSVEEQLFLKRSTLALLVAAGLAVVLAVLIGFLFARQILKPVRQLTEASSALAAGNLGQTVPVSSGDELGQLAATFNQMSSQLVQADQERKRLTADIAHDLGTPLQIIGGYMEILESQQHLKPAQIEIIKLELDHLRRLISDLSTLSQIEAGGMTRQLVPLQPYPLLQRVSDSFQQSAASQRTQLVLMPGNEGSMVLADEDWMLRILRNLVENALRYTPATGRVELAITKAQPVTITVSDSGAGIEPDDLPHVFESFYRGDKTRESASGKMGLGLAIVQALVSAQHGSIAVTSGGAGQGSRFTLTFPAHTI